MVCGFLIGRMTLRHLEAVTSKVCLKMKFYSNKGKVITLDVDKRVAQSCYLKASLTKPTDFITEVNLADLDARYEPNSSDDEEDDVLPRELKKKITKPKTNDQFVLVQIGDDPGKVIMIGSDLYEEVKTALVECL